MPYWKYRNQQRYSSFKLEKWLSKTYKWTLPTSPTTEQVNWLPNHTVTRICSMVKQVSVNTTSALSDENITSQAHWRRFFDERRCCRCSIPADGSRKLCLMLINCKCPICVVIKLKCVCAFICVYIYKRSNNRLLQFATLDKSTPTPHPPLSSYGGGGGDGGTHQRNAANVVFSADGADVVFTDTVVKQS